jgi:hypothetical protein
MLNIIRPGRHTEESKTPCKLCEAMRQAQAEFMRRIGLMQRSKSILPPTESKTVVTSVVDKRRGVDAPL